MQDKNQLVESPDAPRDTSIEKKPYTSPKFISYGQISELTTGLSGESADAGAGSTCFPTITTCGSP